MEDLDYIKELVNLFISVLLQNCSKSLRTAKGGPYTKGKIKDSLKILVLNTLEADHPFSPTQSPPKPKTNYTSKAKW